MNSLFGIPVISHPLLDGFKVPVLRIRDNVPCSQPTRDEVNRYLLETFGSHEIALIFDKAMFLSPKHMAAIRALKHPVDRQQD